uniref:EGF-like domain-containing protein n=1 Tax=Magallana gigas TaxID=29159 RepID=A0A8W8NMW9_MAGGI|nr:delta and Notch-like epidermal growth factor-related receptor [Crassostrea gigas]
MEGCRRLLFSACMCLFIFKRETNASPKSECNDSTDCGENAVCDTSDTDNVCVCKPGFFDNPPIITALSDGCPGECDEYGETDQCEGKTQCTETPQGFGECTCPENTYGPPECLAEGSTTTEKLRRNLILVYGALTIPLLFLVTAALASGLSLG